jgi:Na+/H+-dicarboxylate symporter
VLFGVSLAGFRDRAKPLIDLLDLMLLGMFGIVRMIMKLAPIGTLGAMAYTIGKYGLGSLVQMAELTVAVWAVSILFVLVILGGIMKAVDINIFKLLRHIREEILITLGTSSSEAVLAPLLVKMERLGCAKPIVGMVMPAGYTFNADGTSIYLGMCAIFIAQATNIPLTLGQQAVILITLMLTSKGSAGVAGAGFVTLAATLASMNQIPVAESYFCSGSIGLPTRREPQRTLSATASPRSWWRNGKAPSTKLRPSECWGECVERSAPGALFSYRDRLGRAARGRIRRVGKGFRERPQLRIPAGRNRR